MNLIFGASGHAAEIAWLAQVCTPPCGETYRPDYFVVEDSCTQTQYIGLPVLTESKVREFTGPFNGFIAVGEPNLRQKIQRKFSGPSTLWPILMHASLVFDDRPGRVTLGQGAIVFPNCTMTSQIQIGCHVHINVGCSISHDVRIGDYCTLSPGVHLAGKVSLAERVFLGIGAVVSEKVHICAEVVIGAGAVVVRDIAEPGTYVGVPAKKMA